MSLRTHGIAHFTIPVSNMARSVVFYSEILGLEKISDVKTLVFFRSGRDHVVLAEIANLQPARSPMESRNVHHAFIVESRDFDDSVAFLIAKGVDVFDRDERPTGAVFVGRSAYFPDPDGNIIEIIDLAAMAYRAVGTAPRV